MFDSATEPEQRDFKIYPNPAQHEVKVDLRAANRQPATVSLTDLAGRTLYQKLVDTKITQQHTISTGNYSDGVYLVSVKVSDGTVATLRLVIAR